MNAVENVSAADRSKIPLTRSLGLTTGILLVATIIIGSGVFKKIAPMSAVLMNKEYILLVWGLAGIISILGAFTVAGFATITTDSGGVYEYLRLSIGNLFAFLYGWASFMVINSGGIAALAFIFSQSVHSIVPFPDVFQRWQNVSIGANIYPFESSGVKLVACGTIIILTMINILGTRKGGNLNNIVTVAKIAGIIILVIMGLSYTTHSSAENIVHVSSNAEHTNLFSAVFVALLSAFWAYDGWYMLGFITGEIKNPKRNVPVSIITGIGISMILYLLVNYAYMHVLPLSALATIGENDIAGVTVARVISGNIGATFVALLIIISTFGALNGCIITCPRLYYRMAQEKFFPKKVTHVHPHYRTPYVALIYSMVWCCVLVVSGTFDILTNIVVIVEFLFYIFLGWGLIKMKREGKITSNLILYPVAPVILILFAGGLVINSVIVAPRQSFAGLALALTGIPFYYYYKRKNKIEKNSGYALQINVIAGIEDVKEKE